jgi:UDP-hydrolysing UDP-N-acetyl-D-glucosamine 2-epimerase
MRRVCVVTGNRADYTRVRTALEAIRQRPDLELILVVIGAHLLEKYGRSVDEIVADGFTVDASVHMIVEGENPVTMTKSTGLAIVELATVFERYRPDVVVAVTDRFETLSVAVAASFMNIHVAHIQGGEVTGTIDESIRHAITKFSHIHFPATEDARERIVRMGEAPEYVFNVGCPGTDLVIRVPRLTRAETLAQVNTRYTKEARKLDPDADFLLVMHHPVTTEYGQGVQQTRELLHAIKDVGMQTIMLWPNVDAGSEDLALGVRHFLLEHRCDRVFLFKHFYSEDFGRLLFHTKCMVGNSSAGIRETCYFGTPVVNVGSRQQGRERGKNVVDAPHDREAIRAALERQLAHGAYASEPIYGDGNAGVRMAEILATVKLPAVQKRITY